MGSAVNLNSDPSHLRRFCTSVNLGRFQSLEKYYPRTKPTLDDLGSPTLRFGKALNFFRPFCGRNLVAWPATLHIILKNEAKCSFFKPFCNMFGKCFHIFINQSNRALSLLRIREILSYHQKMHRSLPPPREIILQLLNVSALWRHCLIDEASAPHRVIKLARRSRIPRKWHFNILRMRHRPHRRIDDGE
jgi:hypothetical protein